MRGSSVLLSAGLSSAMALVLSMSTTACGPALGEPMQPTSNQTVAAQQLDGSTSQIVEIKSKPDSAFSLYGTISSLGPLAVSPGAGKSSALFNTLDLSPGCVTGSATAGYTYKCPQVEGSVTFTGTTTNIDLKILSSGGTATAEVTLKGAVSNDGSSIKGDLTTETKVNLGVTLPGFASPNVKTHVTYDIGYQASPACVTTGKILVEYTAAGTGGTAQFEYTGCGTFLVRNG